MGRFHRHDDGTAHSHEHGDHSHDHGDHSGYATGGERIEVLESIFAENDSRAAANRRIFEDNGVRVVNLMSSPGSGKTTVLAATLDELCGQLGVGVIEGDIATDLDAEKLGGRGAQISLLNTSDGFGGECHLDAPMVSRALAGLDLTTLDLVVIENVGNLVCPAEFDVGEHAKVMVYSVTEGEDKPLKYPVMFRSVDIVLLNKIDLVPHLDADVDGYIERVRQVNPAATVLPVSARTGEGMAAWFDWLRRFAAPAAPDPAVVDPAAVDPAVVDYAVVAFDDPARAAGGFALLRSLADTGTLTLIDAEFIRTIAGVPSTVPGGRIDPALAAFGGDPLLGQADLDLVAAAMPAGSVSAVVLTAGGPVTEVLAAWERDGAGVLGHGSVDDAALAAARSGDKTVGLLGPGPL